MVPSATNSVLLDSIIFPDLLDESATHKPFSSRHRHRRPESTFVRQMIEHDELPELASLLREGRWLTVRSPGGIGGGCVWPTFLSRKDPTTHGIYSEWKWIPETMSLRRYDGSHLTPFWKALADDGVSVGVFDVPFASPVGISKGFEVCEWWAHDSTASGLYVGPG